MAGTWNPFEAAVAHAPAGGWPDSPEPVGGWPDDEEGASPAGRERLDSAADPNEPKTGHDFTSPSHHPFIKEDSEVPKEGLTRESALARIAELEARNKFLVSQGQERLEANQEKKVAVRRQSAMLTKTPLTERIDEELAMVPQTKDIVEHWAKEAATVPPTVL